MDYSPFSHPLYIMMKPAGAACNLACEYCYYLEKAERRKQKAEDFTVEETFIKQYIEAQTQHEVLFTWHGGEPLLKPISFYREMLHLQQKHAGGHSISNSLQTNGTLLNDEWCRFFRQHHFLIGISIDGTQQMHDHYRRTRNNQPTFERVMRGISLLNKHGVDWNAMAVVNRLNAEQPREFYRFFRSIGCRFLQFTPVVERHTQRPDGLTLAPGMCEEGELASFSVTPKQWGRFLCEVYDEWVRQDVGRIYVQLFDATLANWVGVSPGLCTMSASCGHAAALEANGNLYSCDHFVYPEYLLGNIARQTITAMMYGPQQRAFAQMKTQRLPRQCRECQFLFACHGECPKNRFSRDCYGEPYLNYLCTGYRQFFTHVAADMQFMANELAHRRPPANIMAKYKNGVLLR